MVPSFTYSNCRHLLTSLPLFSLSGQNRRAFQPQATQKTTSLSPIPPNPEAAFGPATQTRERPRVSTTRGHRSHLPEKTNPHKSFPKKRGKEGATHAGKRSGIDHAPSERTATTDPQRGWRSGLPEDTQNRRGLSSTRDCGTGYTPPGRVTEPSACPLAEWPRTERAHHEDRQRGKAKWLQPADASPSFFLSLSHILYLSLSIPFPFFVLL